MQLIIRKHPRGNSEGMFELRGLEEFVIYTLYAATGIKFHMPQNIFIVPLFGAAAFHRQATIQTESILVSSLLNQVLFQILF